MKTIVLLIGLFWSGLAAGQIGIGIQNPDTNAMLEISSTNKGVLFPRMSNVQMSEVKNPTVGLIIYNTDQQGFFGYDGVSWTQEVFMPSDAWGTKGNDTGSSVMTVGTNNNVAFNFRTNNKKVMTILPNPRQVRVEGENLQTSRFFVGTGQKDGSNPSIFIAHSAGFGNAAFSNNMVITNINGSGSVMGNYAFAASIEDAEAGKSAGGMSYILDAEVKGISFYTGGHPTGIDDRSKEVMIITDPTTNRNVGIGVHVPKSKLHVDGDIYISNSSNGLIIKDNNGGCHRITVGNDGGLNTSGVIACP